MAATPTLRINVAPNYRDPQFWYGNGRRAGTTQPGLIKLEHDNLVLQYEETVYNKSYSKTTTTTQSFTLPLRALEAVAYRKFWWGHRIVIEANDLKAFEGIYGAYAGKLTLYVKRASKGLAASFVSDVQLRLSELRIQRE